MRVFLDADILFNSVNDLRTRTLLHRIKNADHDIILSVSVLGEIMLVCISEDGKVIFSASENLCSELKPNFVVSLDQFRICKLCLNKFDSRSSNPTDKDH